jgi:hypothetical protein
MLAEVVAADHPAMLLAVMEAVEQGLVLAMGQQVQLIQVAAVEAAPPLGLVEPVVQA